MILAIKQILAELRPKQWLKNIIIFFPVFFVDQLNSSNFLNLSICFLLFSLTASSLYIVNDIFDRSRDCFHPQKKLRSIASRQLSLKKAKLAAFILLALAVIISISFNLKLFWILFSYISLMFLYSYKLKNIIIADLVIIALGFDLRIIAGASIIDIEINIWLLAAVFFVALFLATIKRQLELKLLKEEASKHREVFRFYTKKLLKALSLLSTILAIASSLIFFLKEPISR